MLMASADLQLIVCQRGGAPNGSIHAHAHLCFVDLLGALHLLLFADRKGAGVHVFYDSEDWGGDEAAKQPACEQGRHQQDRCTPGGTTSN